MAMSRPNAPITYSDAQIKHATELLSVADDHLKLHRTSAALKTLTYIIKIYPDFAEAYYARGYILYKIKDYVGAKNDLTLAVELDSLNTTYISLLGQVYFDSQQYNEAIIRYTRILAITPNDGAAYYNRAYVYAKIGNKVSALNDYNQSIIYSPNVPRSYNMRGITNKNLGNFNAAIDDYTQAIELSGSEFTLAYYNRAIAHQLNDNLPAALQDMSQHYQLSIKKLMVEKEMFLLEKKEWLLASILNLKTVSGIGVPQKNHALIKSLLLLCLDKSSDLGKIMWEQRGLYAPSITAGVLKEIVSELLPYGVVIDPKDYPSQTNAFITMFTGGNAAPSNQSSAQAAANPRAK